jgi:hypothetical protein
MDEAGRKTVRLAGNLLCLAFGRVSRGVQSMREEGDSEWGYQPARAPAVPAGNGPARPV